MPRISIIVPVYKVEKYIHRCVDSILEQTFTDIEVILVDDGSPDNCGTICDEYAARDERVIAIHQRNNGLSAARNVGIKCAHANWVMFVDSDDIIHPQMVELLYNTVQASGAKLCMCGHVAGEEVPASFRKPVDLEYTRCLLDESSLVEILLKGGSRYWVAWCKLIDKEIALKYPFPEGRIYEDNAVVYRWIHEAGIIADVVQELYFYRQREGSIMHQRFSYRNLDYVWVLEQQIEFYQTINYEKMLVYVSGMYVRTCANVYRNILKWTKDREIARDIRKKLINYTKK